MDLDLIIAAFWTSREYTQRFGGMSDAELVHTLYRNLFDNDAEPDGLTFYLALPETWRAVYDGDDKDATEHALSSIALDIPPAPRETT